MSQRYACPGGQVEFRLVPTRTVRGALNIIDGRRFSCTRCGNCCMEPGWVFFSDRELKAMAAHLELSVPKFMNRFGVADEGEGRWGIDARDGGGCPLLDDEQGCSVQPVKPLQCSSFPFWPELLDDALAWKEIKRYCPGLDAKKGRLYSEDEILEIRLGSGLD